MKIHPLGAESFYEDEQTVIQTDLTKLIITLSCERAYEIKLLLEATPIFMFVRK